MVVTKVPNTTLKGLKLWQLKYSAFLLGLGTTGTRASLESLIERQVVKQHSQPGKKRRIVSVDMGIRNLAFCVLETSSPPAQAIDDTNPLATEICVKAWKKIDLLDTLTRVNATSDDGPSSDEDSIKEMAKAAFTPSVMCKTAYDTTQVLLDCQPDAILIERQRFRSGGAAAIQEWTVRVNMLESMLWACLRTLSETAGSKAFPSIHEVSPARVANFWLASSTSPNLALRPPADILAVGDKASKHDGRIVQLVRGKVDKKDKIAVVRAWIDKSEEHALREEVALQFEGEAAQVADAFRANKKQSRAARSALPREEQFGKLDDLADCLLQGAAWVRWEENQRRMIQLLGK